VCKSEGGANDEEEWSYIDASKGGKGGKSLMGKLGVEQNGRTLGCDGVLERRRSLVKERGRFLVIREHKQKRRRKRRSNHCEKVEKALCVGSLVEG